MITGGIPNIYQGVSQQPDPMRDPTQGKLQVNGVSSPMDGLRKREGSELVARISTTAAQFEAVAFHHIRRDPVNQYLAVFSRTLVRVFRLDGTAVPVLNAGQSYLEQAVDASRDLRAITTGDFTFLTNLRAKVSMDPSLAPSPPRPSPHEAIVFVRAANYGQDYRLVVNGVSARVETATSPSSIVNGVVVANPISAEGVAAQLRGILVGGVVTGLQLGGGAALFLSVQATATTLNGNVPNIAATTAGGGSGLVVTVFGNGTVVTGVSIVNGGTGMGVGDGVFVPRNLLEGGVITTPVQIATVTSASGRQASLAGSRTGLETTTSGGGSGLQVAVFGDGTAITSIQIEVQGRGYQSGDAVLLPRNLLQGGADTTPVRVATIGAATDGNLTGVTISQRSSVLHLRSQNPITLAATDARGNADITAILDTVQSFTDLPAVAPNGYQVQITGDATNKFDGYYVRFASRGTEFNEGVWEESVASGVEYKINPATMPHLLVRAPDGLSFWFGPANGPEPFPGLVLPSWGQRTAGDYDSNPDPPFVGLAINDIFIFGNRLCFLSGENCVCSRAGSYFDFFRETVTTVLDSDPIGSSANQDKISLLSYAVFSQDEILLFSQELQFRYGSDDGPLTPATAKVSVLTSHQCDLGCRPIQMGGGVVFAQPNGDWSQIREFRMFGSGSSVNVETSEITDHVRTYVPAQVKQMVANEAGNILVVLPGKNCFRDRLYIYKWFYAPAPGGGLERTQKSWSFWEFSSDEIKAILCVDQTLFMVARYGAEIWLEKISVADRPQKKFAGNDEDGDSLVVPYELYLDRRISTTLSTPLPIRVSAGVYDPATDRTCWTLPYPIRGKLQAWSAFTDISRCAAQPVSLPTVALTSRSPTLATNCGTFNQNQAATANVTCGDINYNTFSDLDFLGPYTFTISRATVSLNLLVDPLAPAVDPTGIYIFKYNVLLPFNEGIALARVKSSYSFTGTSPEGTPGFSHFTSFDGVPVASSPPDPDPLAPPAPFSDFVIVAPRLEIASPGTTIVSWSQTLILSSSFVLTRTGPTTSPLTVNVAFGGTASETDYAPYFYTGLSQGEFPLASSAITFAIGENTKRIIIAPKLFDLISGGKTVVMTVLPSSNYIVGAGSPGTVTILQA